jgi:hypothetical protein
MRPLLTCVAVVLALAGIASRAEAAPILYEVSGVASGQIGGTPFSNVLVRFAGLGDTANIVTADFGGTVYANRFSALTVSIGGFGMATITDASDIISIPFALPPNDEIPSIPIIIFGRIDPPFSDPFQFTGMGAVGSSLLAGYNLATAIGPINSFGGVGFIQGCSTPGHDPCLHTTAGLLSFTTNILETNAGTFRATPVPEPATLLLVASGVGVLVRRSGRRQA